MKNSFLILLLLTTFGFASAQINLVERRFDLDDCRAMVATNDGYYFLAIDNEKQQIGDEIVNHYTSKLVFFDRNLQKIWEKPFERGESPTLISLKRNGNRLYLAGTSNDSKYASIRAWLVCTDLKGNQLWEKKYGFTGNQIVEGKGIYPTADGDLILHAHAFRTERSTGFPVLYRLSSSGEIVWQKTYGKAFYYPDFSNGTITQDGNLVFSGFAYRDQNAFLKTNTFEAYAAKIDALNGSVIWENSYPGQGYAVMQQIVEGASGNLMAMGSHGPNCVGRKAFQWILSPNGELIQSMAIQAREKSSIECLHADLEAEKIYATGMIEKNTQGKSGYLTVFSIFDLEFRLLETQMIDAENGLQLTVDSDGTPIAMGKKSLLFIQ